MAQLFCEIVTAERRVYAGDVSQVTAPTVEGEVTILPRHAPLLSALDAGEIRLMRPGQEEVILAVGGGFMEVRDDRVIILADTAERADEIDYERALQAKQKAQQLLHQQVGEIDFAKAEAALRRSMARLKAAEHTRTRRRSGGGAGQNP